MSPRGTAVAIVAVAFAGLAQDAGGPRIRFVAPSPATIPVGPTPIEVEVDGAAAGDAVELFVDGRKLATLTHPPWRHEWNAGDAPRSRVLTAAVTRGGQEVAKARLQTASVGFSTQVTSRAVSLSPVVTDAGGRYVTGLGKEAFEVYDEGARQEIETFDSSGPLSAALVLDVSGSMLLKMASAREAAHRLLDALEPEDEVSLMTFSSSLATRTAFTRDRAALHARLDEVRTQGETALYDATAAALQRLAPFRHRKAVVLFTDGEDNRSRLSVDQVARMARASEVSIYAVAQGRDTATTLRVYLDLLTTKTGGRCYFIGDIKGLPRAFDEIVTELKSQYFLTYTPRARPEPRTWRRVEVRVRPAGLTVRAKKEYFVE